MAHSMKSTTRPHKWNWLRNSRGFPTQIGTLSCIYGTRSGRKSSKPYRNSFSDRAWAHSLFMTARTLNHSMRLIAGMRKFLRGLRKPSVWSWCWGIRLTNLIRKYRLNRAVNGLWVKASASPKSVPRPDLGCLALLRPSSPLSTTSSRKNRCLIPPRKKLLDPTKLLKITSNR